jgi:hypothetical protein
MVPNERFGNGYLEPQLVLDKIKPLHGLKTRAANRSTLGKASGN